MNKKEESEKKNMKNTSGMNLLMLFIVLTAFVVLSKLQRKLISYCHVINNCNIIIIQNLLSLCTMCKSHTIVECQENPNVYIFAAHANVL